MPTIKQLHRQIINGLIAALLAACSGFQGAFHLCGQTTEGPALRIPDQRLAHENHRQEVWRGVTKRRRPGHAQGSTVHLAEFCPALGDVSIFCHQAASAGRAVMR